MYRTAFDVFVKKIKKLLHEDPFYIELRRLFSKEKHMSTFAITADIRTKDEKVSTLRKNKKVPGVVYWKTQEPISFSMDSSEFLRLYRKAWESNIIDLKIGKEDLEVLVHQTQKHHITGDFTHVDFYAITRWEALQTNIAFNFINDAPAQKEGAIVEEIMKEVSVKCLPRNLVPYFDVDLSLIKTVEDSIRISDLNIDSEKYELLVGDDDLVVSASMPRVEVIPDDAPESELPEWVADEPETWDSTGEEK